MEIRHDAEVEHGVVSIVIIAFEHARFANMGSPFIHSRVGKGPSAHNIVYAFFSGCGNQLIPKTSSGCPPPPRPHIEGRDWSCALDGATI